MSFLDDAENRLHRYFSDGWWDIYDGVNTPQNATLTVTDLVLSVALNSQLNTRTKIWYLWKHRAPIEQTLAVIPPDLTLESENIPWLALGELFEQFCAIKYAKEAVATKVLHKKRPNLIPIYDRFIGAYFQPMIPPQLWHHGGAPFLIEYMRLFRNLLLTHRHEVYRLCAVATAEGWPVTPVRMLEVLVWMDQELKGYYR